MPSFFSHVSVDAVSRSAANSGLPDTGHDDQNIVEIDKSNVLLMGPTGSGSYSFIFLKKYLAYLPCFEDALHIYN